MFPPHDTKIVATIGPATESPEVLEALIRAGMNVARLNFSHGEFESHGRVIARIRTISADLGVPVAILAERERLLEEQVTSLRIGPDAAVNVSAESRVDAQFSWTIPGGDGTGYACAAGARRTAASTPATTKRQALIPRLLPSVSVRDKTRPETGSGRARDIAT